MYPYQPIINIVEICAQHGIKYVILSPGSRCAPLTIAFVRHPNIKTLTIPDERSAAFIAMGVAQQLNEPVALLCTSGSAGLNYYPAIAEAYYQQIPLLVLTADRPPEWIDQADGQTIRQREMYANHIKASYELPVDYAHPDAVWQVERTVNKAINLCRAFPPAPVHINLPFREPLYPPKDFEMKFDKNVRIIKEIASEPTLSESAWEEILEVWNQAGKVLVVGGQDRLDLELCEYLIQSYNKLGIVVISDIISNLHPCKYKIQLQDIFLVKKEIQEELGQADLLITFGKSLISKSLKQYLRNYKPKQHWHIQQAGNVPDTFKNLGKIIRTTPKYFFKTIFGHQNTSTSAHQHTNKRLEYNRLWLEKNQLVVGHLFDLFVNNKEIQNLPFSELEVVFEVNRLCSVFSPVKITQLHLANSMTVRYANYLNSSYVMLSKQVEIFSNRGTSGIDGCVSTAVGHALANPEKMNVLIIGDLAFLYDRNGLWHNYLPENLRIVVLNNHGGGIFKMIDAGTVSEAEEYFVTKQTWKAERTALDAGMEYFYTNNRTDFQEIMKYFFERNGKAKLLEIETDIATNMKVLNEYKNL
ncbi:MAG: 2-succinyl-5-enolpyruvyl-6-hydroxy-3-cyclohexene-1-carboxylic-acid synthase [Thermoflexibacter sp.]|jgi:2-succinyl-5-enolpyruvyl-6-hydroxy-3-cyclohexene-1-carboxylate synthase|nr:2-succinyl-5-enolpyruvyl-6-hydroxy-3-cyclohexene-1-carboxylic-acid synthase [Thermoflexibacter sp.]